MVVEEFQPAQDILPAAADEGNDVRGSNETVPVNEPDNGEVALRQFKVNRGCASEAGKSVFHGSMVQ